MLRLRSGSRASLGFDPGAFLVTDSDIVETPESLLRKRGFSDEQARVAVLALGLTKDKVRALGDAALEEIKQRTSLSLDRSAILEQMRAEGVRRLAALGVSEEDAGHLVDAGFSVDALTRLGKDKADELIGEARKKAAERAKELAEQYGVDPSAMSAYGKNGYRIAQAAIDYGDNLTSAMMLLPPDWHAEGTSKEALESFGVALAARSAVSKERREEEANAQRRLFGEVAAVSAVGGPVGILVGSLLYGFSEFSIWLKGKVFTDWNAPEYVDRAKAAAQTLFNEWGLLPPDLALFGNAKDLAQHLEATADWYRAEAPKGSWIGEWRKILRWALETDDPRVADLAVLGWFPFSNLDFQGFLPLEHGGLPGYVSPTSTYAGMIGNRAIPQGIDPQGGRAAAVLIPKNLSEVESCCGVRLEKGVNNLWLIRYDPRAIRRSQACAAAIGMLIARYYHAKEGKVVEAAVRSLERTHPVVTLDEALATIDAGDQAILDEAASHGADGSMLDAIRAELAKVRTERAGWGVALSGLPYVALGSPEVLGQVVEASIKASGSVSGIAGFVTPLTGPTLAKPALLGAGAGALAAFAWGGPVGWAVGAGAFLLSWWMQD